MSALNFNPVMIPIATNAGGDGKTFTTMILATLFDLLKIEVVIIDADPGNRAANEATIGAQALDPFAPADHIVPAIKAAVSGNKSLIIDVGANMLASSREFERTLRRTGNELRKQGWDVFGLWVISPNKLAAALNIEDAAELIDPPSDPIFVFNDRDNSGKIPEGFTPSLRVEHLQPGLVSLVNKHGFTSLVTLRLPGFDLSAYMIAAYLWQFADQAAVRAMPGDSKVNGLRQLLDRAVTDISPFALAQTLTDTELRELAARARMHRCLIENNYDFERSIAALQALRAERN